MYFLVRNIIRSGVAYFAKKIKEHKMKHCLFSIFVANRSGLVNSPHAVTGQHGGWLTAAWPFGPGLPCQTSASLW
jgi:hypothetical protein